jgi:flagellar protein FlaG
MDLSQMSGVVADIQKNLGMIHDVDLQFSVHEASGEIMVTVREESSGKVIREIPPSEMLDLAARLGEMVGLLFDQTG